MDTRKVVLLTVVAISQLPGCSGFSIHQHKSGTDADTADGSADGIPFYRKIGVDKQTTVYTRTWFDVHFILEDVDPNKPEKTKNKREGNLAFSQRRWNDTKAATANDRAVKAAELGCPLERIIKDYEAAIGINPLTMKTIADEADIAKSTTDDGLNQSMISNVIKQETVVDYDNVYYYNVTIPAFGTANATLKLAGDGTLTEASSAVDTTKLADVIPLAEFLTKKLHLEQKEKPQTAAFIIPPAGKRPEGYDECKSKGPHNLMIENKQVGYVYTLSRKCSMNNGKNVCDQAITFPNAEGVSITRTVLGGGDKKEEKKMESNTATFSGSLVLPEAKEKSP